MEHLRKQESSLRFAAPELRRTDGRTDGGTEGRKKEKEREPDETGTPAKMNEERRDGKQVG